MTDHLLANVGACSLAMALSPSEVMRRCGLEPEPWQVEELDARHRRNLWNICRGGGKSTTAGVLAIYELLYGRALHGQDPLVLAVAPAERQSRLLLRRVRTMYRRLGGVPPTLRDTVIELEIGDGMMVALPGTEGTIRGYQSVTLLLLDEAARLPDDVFDAVFPMLHDRARVVALSTPAGQRGEFWRLMTNTKDFPEWRRVVVNGEQSARISKRKLAEERRRMTPVVFASEYGCSFRDSAAQIFPTDLVRAALTDEVEPLVATWIRFAA